MRYYIVDDSIGIVKAIENVIESRDIGDVIGFETFPDKAVEEIVLKKPDIVLVDLLMPTMDGIEIVKKVNSIDNNISFVMISKVSDKEMIAQAYDAGIEFFIQKPINLKEIESVLGNVAEKRKMNSMMNDIKGIFRDDDKAKQSAQVSSAGDEIYSDITFFLGMLGMNGEKGTTDIINICRYLLRNGGFYNKTALEAVANMSGDSSKNIEQRMRRAIKKGLGNVAGIGLSDFGNDIFQIYANYVFDFKSIKDEMNYIEGKNQNGGRVAIPKFIDGLIMYKNSKNV